MTKGGSFSGFKFSHKPKSKNFRKITAFSKSLALGICFSYPEFDFAYKKYFHFDAYSLSYRFYPEVQLVYLFVNSVSGC